MILKMRTKENLNERLNRSSARKYFLCKSAAYEISPTSIAALEILITNREKIVDIRKRSNINLIAYF